MTVEEKAEQDARTRAAVGAVFHTIAFAVVAVVDYTRSAMEQEDADIVATAFRRVSESVCDLAETTR